MEDYSNISIYRKRFIPDETNYLKDDVILHVDDSKIFTSWKALKARSDIERGVSAYFLNRGYKVSKLYDKDENVVYWYCDMINVVKNSDEEYIFEDLLLDVIVYEDGRVVVMDADELATAMEDEMIPQEYVSKALRYMNDLLKIIYSGQFKAIQKYIDEAEKYYGNNK